MHYGMIKNVDIADGPGVRVSLFVSGCRHRCEGCFQPETWDFNYGEEFTDITIQQIISMMDKPFVRGLTLLGGEPFEPENRRDLVKLLKRVRWQVPDKNVWAYSGYTYSEILKMEEPIPMLEYIDVLVDGPFILSRRDITLRFRGSANQRIIDVQKSLASKQIILWEDKKYERRKCSRET